MRHKILSAITFLSLAFAVLGQAKAEDTAFVDEPEFSDDVVNFVPADSGEYRYQQPENDHRPMTQPFMMEKPPRTDYVFFSNVENLALESLSLRKLRAIQRAHENYRRLGLHTSHLPLIAWPKVVLIENKICVPELAYSQAVDWKNHLTCWENKGEQ